MKKNCSSIIPLLFCWLSFAAAAEKPNILIVFTDDHGYADLGILGNDPDVRTPNIDQLARDGALFTRGYATAPQCVPSRAGLLTGRHQNAFGMDDNFLGPLPLSEITIADRLREAGYVTGMVGKWHMEVGNKSAHPDWDGSRKPEDLARYYPHNRGFDEYWFGPINEYETNFLLDGSDHPDAPAMVTDRRLRTDVQTEAALAFLKRREGDKRPFFLYLAWFAPHAPMATPPQLRDGLNGQNFWEQMAHVKETERRQALALIKSMDCGMGLIREKLQETGVAESTLIFFMSDNGAPLKEGAYVGSLNTPTVGEKGMLTDGGQRIPFVAAWPGTIPPGQVFDEPVWTLDAAATALAVAGASVDDKIEGVNLMPWLTGKKEGPMHDALCWRWREQAAILSGNWKFVRLGNERRYLFDMTEIGRETAADNKIAEYPEIAAKLEAQLVEKANTWAVKGLEDEVQAAARNSFDQHVEKTLPPLPLGEGRTAADRVRRPKAPANKNRKSQNDEPDDE